MQVRPELALDSVNSGADVLCFSRLSDEAGAQRVGANQVLINSLFFQLQWLGSKAQHLYEMFGSNWGVVIVCPLITEQGVCGASITEDVVDSVGKCFDGAFGLANCSLMNGFIHSTIFLVGDLESGSIAPEEYMDQILKQK